MFYLIHALAGIFIGKSLNSLILISLLAFISHFLLDMIPHWDGHFDKSDFIKSGKAKIKKSTFLLRAVDGILGISAIIFFYYQFNLIGVLIGGFFAVLPDMIKIGYYSKLKNNKYFNNYLKFHAKIQRDVSRNFGIIIQILISLIILYFITF
ncbi:MAG: hypothetical protein WC781_00160 [Candidatus Pacearchaeota archaeon]|jgi:hypothetical protein